MSDGSVSTWRDSARSRLPGHASLCAWLKAPGSLTAHLSRCFGPVEVQRLRQGCGRARADEALALGLRAGQRVWVREVVLRCQGKPMVMARSVCETRHLRGVWRALRGLGSRPLAELLFNDTKVGRQPLSFAKLAPHQRQGRFGQLAWKEATGLLCGLERSGGAVVMWQRRSVFTRLGAGLLVTEMFSPLVQSKRPIVNSLASRPGRGT